MNSARAAGALFLIAMASSITGHMLIVPLISDADYLAAVFEGSMILRVAAIFMLVNSVSVVGIGVLLHKLLAQHSSFTAHVYLAARIIESVVLIFGVVSLLSLISLGQAYTSDAALDSSYISTLGELAVERNWYCYHIAMISLGAGSLFFCYALLKRRLIPVFLSVLGVVGYTILAATSVLAILDVDLGLVVTIPVFAFEVILGFWLILKGIRQA